MDDIINDLNYINEEKLLRRGLKKMSFAPEGEKLERIIKFLHILTETNQRQNLIGTEEKREIIVRHFFDCLAPLQILNPRPSSPWMDLGSGAGLPGIIWKIMEKDIDIYLLDSRQRRVDFLRSAGEKLNLKGLYPLCERAEKLGKNKDWREKFAFVTARAVAELNVLLELSLPLIKVGGTAGFFKGPRYKNELDRAGEALKILGGRLTEAKKISVPFLDAERYFLLVKKISPVPGRFPREIGVPEKRPL